MKKLYCITVLLVLLPVLSFGQETETKRIMIFPLKSVSETGKVSFTTEPTILLGNQLAREGGVDVVAGQSLVSLVKGKKVDLKRIARMAQRMGLDAVLWGTVKSLTDGYSLELWAMGRDPQKKPKFFSTSGKDMEKLFTAMGHLSGEIGRVVLGRPTIGTIRVEGNKRIETPTILSVLKMKTGAPFSKSGVAEDIRAIYSLGYFDDVQVKTDKGEDGRVDLDIIVKERPFIKEIEITGSKQFSKDQILDALTTKSLRVLSLRKIANDIVKLKKMYEKEGFYEPEITYDIKELSRNEAKLVFKIKEGVKSYLTRVVLDGAKEVSAKELKRVALNIKEKSWFWFLDESGTFTREKLEENRRRLIGYYLNKGFLDVQVGAPKMVVKGGSVTVTYPIKEGHRFQVRKVAVTGDLIMPKNTLLKLLGTKSKTWCNSSTVHDDVETLTKIYNNAGYANADVEPIRKLNTDHDFVDLTYRITKGPKVKIGRVDIRGNDRTRGKVIRRALAIGEGEYYNAKRIDVSKKNLEGMDFFEAVQIKTHPGPTPGVMDLEVKVQEKKTGSLAAGIGYSSQDGAMGNVNLKERNLLGMGIVANIQGSLSGRRNNYEGSLSYPWIMDYPLRGTVNGYKHQQSEKRYFRESDGFGLHFGYPVYGFWGLSAGFAHDSTKLSGFQRPFRRSVTEYYKRYGFNAERYKNVSENSVSVALTRDTRYGSPIPMGGSKLVFGSRFSGFGGDVAFSRYFSDVVYYRHLFWKAVFKAKASGSALIETAGFPIPFDRRILLGGISSIRGYQARQIGPIDRYGNIIGGDRSLFGSLECLFPLLQRLRMNGVVFVDAGNTWNAIDKPLPDEIKAGAGVGVRWMSPMGPIRIEYGWKLTPEIGEAPGAFAFAMGELF
jgi:outer membrane protein insertion porin family